MAEPCPGGCNAWWRGLTEDQRAASETRPWQGDPVWCHRCAAAIRASLARLDYLAAMHAFTADGYREPGQDAPRRGVHAPSPSAAMDDAEELTGWLLDWEDAYRKERGLGASMRHGYLADVRSEVIAFLAERLDSVLAMPFAADFGTEVLQWHRELSSKTKAGTGQHRKPVPCPRCGLKLLTWREGDDHVQCGGCNRHMTMDEYQAEVAAGLERAG